MIRQSSTSVALLDVARHLSADQNGEELPSWCSCNGVVSCFCLLLLYFTHAPLLLELLVDNVQLVFLICTGHAGAARFYSPQRAVFAPASAFLADFSILLAWYTAYSSKRWQTVSPMSGFINTPNLEGDYYAETSALL